MVDDKILKFFEIELHSLHNVIRLKIQEQQQQQQQKTIGNLC